MLLSAQDYVVVGKAAKVFDEPDATGFVSLNSKNQEVTLQPGMAFKKLEKQTGWNIIEYSPGIRGYVSDQALAPKTVMPKPGTYKVANKAADSLKADNANGAWTATVNGKTYNGKAFGNVVVFFSDPKTPAYSLVDLGNGPVAMTYDNSVTKFF